MKAPFKLWFYVLAGLAFAARASFTQADTVKQGLFQLGGDLWLIDTLAAKGSPKSALDRQALTKLLQQCIQDCQALGFSCDSLLDLQGRGDQLTLPECARRLVTVRGDIRKHMEKAFGPPPRRGPSAQSYFLLGQYTNAATVTALYVKLSGQRENQDNRKFIYRMCASAFAVRNNAQLEVSLPPLVAVLGKVKQGISFAELYDALCFVSRTWQRELGKAPPLPVAVRHTAPLATAE